MVKAIVSGCGLPEEILVTALNIHVPHPDLQWERMAQCLTENRRARMSGYRRTDDRKRCIAGQWLVEYTLRHFTGQWDRDFTFQRSRTGKPFPVGIEEVFFNLSHAGDWVCCAVADVPVGIDVEAVRHMSPELCSFCLSEKERLSMDNLHLQTVQSGEDARYLRNVVHRACGQAWKCFGGAQGGAETGSPPGGRPQPAAGFSPVSRNRGVTDCACTEPEAERMEWLAQIWTMKESYLKMTGEGLRKPMHSFCVIKETDHWTARPDTGKEAWHSGNVTTYITARENAGREEGTMIPSKIYSGIWDKDYSLSVCVGRV